MRAVPGNRVRSILKPLAETTSFFVSESTLAAEEKHFAGLVIRRQGDSAKALRLLRAIAVELYLFLHDASSLRLRVLSGYPDRNSVRL